MKASNGLNLARNLTPAVVTDSAVLDWLGEAEREADATSRKVAELIHARAPWLAEPIRERLARLIAARPEYLGGPRYRFSVDFFSNNIPQWTHDLARFAGAPDLEFLEVGSFEGFSACWLIDHVLTHERSRLTCIDTFQPGLFSERKEELFDHNIERSGAAHRVVKLRALSQVALRTLPPGTFDFIYIDGSHFAPRVLEDAVLSWALLKPGGLVTFDDYLWQGGDGEPPPALAIDSFLRVYQGEYSLIHSGYQVTLEKRGRLTG